MTVMRDSTTAKDIPADSDMVMGYVDGRYAWSGEDWGLFPTAVHVRCSVNAFGGEAEVLDVETGDATPQQVPGWVGRMRGLGIPRPTIYCNRATLGYVDAALHDAGVAVADCALLVATLDGSTVTGISAHGYEIVGCQNKGTAQTGGHYDESIIFDHTWPRAAEQAAPPATPTTTTEDEDMAQAQQVQRGLNDVVRFLGGGSQPTAADLNWDDAHALALGAGGEEFLIEGLVAGTDPAEDQQVIKGLRILHQLAQGVIPPELHDAVRAIAQQQGG